MTLTEYDEFRGFTDESEEEYPDPLQPAFLELLAHAHDEKVDWSWHAKGACKDADTALFFPEVETSPEADQAKRICKRCPVQYECLEHALNWPEEYGIWGGLTGVERERLRKERRGVTVPNHGTVHCFWSGCRRAECKEAWNAYRIEQRRRKREVA